jgi:hypothetical protein
MPLPPPVTIIARPSNLFTFAWGRIDLISTASSAHDVRTLTVWQYLTDLETYLAGRLLRALYPAGAMVARSIDAWEEA